MKYHINDMFLLDGIEAKVAFINGQGHAYLTPLIDSNYNDYYYGHKLLMGVVFAILDIKGRDIKTKHKAITINNHNCAAV